MSPVPHDADPAKRRQVEAMSAYGIPETEIARVIGIDPKTLRKHYRDELDLGATKANIQVAGFLFNSARNGNVTAQIFWLKTRARWRERDPEPDPNAWDLTVLSDEDLDHLERIGMLATAKTINCSVIESEDA